MKHTIMSSNTTPIASDAQRINMVEVHSSTPASQPASPNQRRNIRGFMNIDYDEVASAISKVFKTDDEPRILYRNNRRGFMNIHWR
jgi:hypothetical protein